MALSNLSDAQTALVGMYDGIQGNSSSISWYGAKQFYRADVAGDLMNANGNGKRTSSDWELNYTAPSSPNMWNVPYNVIRRANNIIAAINGGNITDGTPAQVNHIKGQALAVRALAHFDLARNYGMPYTADNGASLGTPLVLEPAAPDALPSRNTVAEMYTQIISDLTEAISLMNNAKNIGYLNQQGAQALLARVYLYKGDNQLAYNTAVNLIENGGYKLWSTNEYATAWANQGSSEVIWELVNFSAQDWTDREGIQYLSKEAGYADFCISKKASDYFNANPDDIRNDIIVASVDPANIVNYGDNKVWITKYPNRVGESDIRVGNSIVFRLTEQYLIAAEAAIKLGDQPNADKYLNAVRQRAIPTASTITATLDNILWEKGIEFIGEGHRLYDLMRNNLESDRTDSWSFLVYPNQQSIKFDRTYYRVILAIPQSELNVNINMVQNPGYAT